MLNLTKVSGPGEFPKISGKGTVRGEYTWTVPNPYRAPRILVGFTAEDPYHGSHLAYLFIYIPQPPQAYGASTRVPSFAKPDGLEVRVVAAERLPPRYYGSHYYGHAVQVEVKADARLRPGTYSVPFTVTDPDGNSASATLTV